MTRQETFDKMKKQIYDGMIKSKEAVKGFTMLALIRHDIAYSDMDDLNMFGFYWLDVCQHLFDECR